MSGLLKWSPFESARWPTPAGASGTDPSLLPDSVERVFDTRSGPTALHVRPVDDRVLMVRAEMPGADPERDIEVSVAAGVLHIRAEHHGSEPGAHGGVPAAGSGSFSCHVPLPEGLTDEDIKASYKDGVLEVRALVPECLTAATRRQRLPISHG